jgi:hypothetical protein
MNDRPARPFEILAGRSAAAFVHPIAAWQRLSRAGRLLLIAGYSAAGYVTVLAALLGL